MGFLDNLFGRDQTAGYDAPPARSTPSRNNAAQSPNEQAVARYLYLLKTAPPEEIEKAHAEAFVNLSPQQRRSVLEQLGQVVPQAEYSRLDDDPQSLARAATRAEMQRPGALRQAFGGAGGMRMPGMGAMMMGGLFSSLAGAFIGTSVAHAFFNNPANETGFQESPESNGDTASESTQGDAGGEFDAGNDAGQDSVFEASSDEMDAGFDAGDFGDFGGGDFGGDF